jgi:methionyl-tRNA synthetase
MKITKKELKELISEEASRYVRTELLKERKEKIQRAIDKINEGEDITEEEMNELFGNVGAGLKSVGKMIGGKAKEVAGKVSDATKAATAKAGEAVKSAAGEVKQAYQSGVDKAKYEKAQKEIAQIAQQIKTLRQKAKDDVSKLQDRYSQLTGGKPFKGAVHNPVMSEGRVIWVEKK